MSKPRLIGDGVSTNGRGWCGCSVGETTDGFSIECFDRHAELGIAIEYGLVLFVDVEYPTFGTTVDLQGDHVITAVGDRDLDLVMLVLVSDEVSTIVRTMPFGLDHHRGEMAGIAGLLAVVFRKKYYCHCAHETREQEKRQSSTASAKRVHSLVHFKLPLGGVQNRERTNRKQRGHNIYYNIIYSIMSMIDL